MCVRVFVGGAVSFRGWIWLTGLLVVAFLVLYTLSSVLVSSLVLIGAGRMAPHRDPGMIEGFGVDLGFAGHGNAGP